MQQAEFDQFADEYYQQHEDNIRISGESPEYFARYKIAVLREQLGANSAARLLDFGCGIGNSIPFFREYFPQSQLTCADVSERSMALSRERFTGNEIYSLISPEALHLPDATQDIVFSACVFHHIAHSEHAHWLKELWRVTAPGGVLFIVEHNPYNPITQRLVNTCPLDVNAHLITPRQLMRYASEAGWVAPKVRYHLFFPALLKALRPMEAWLGRVPFGGQYSLFMRKPVA